jgi:hypothetical protein
MNGPFRGEQRASGLPRRNAAVVKFFVRNVTSGEGQSWTLSPTS